MSPDVHEPRQRAGKKELEMDDPRRIEAQKLRAEARAKEEKAVRLEAAAERMHDVYCGDDYPRLVCVAKVKVTRHGYCLQIEAPGRGTIETYAAVRTPEQIARMVCDWCAGHVPRLRGGQSDFDSGDPKQLEAAQIRLKAACLLFDSDRLDPRPEIQEVASSLTSLLSIPSGPSTRGGPVSN